MQHELWQKCSSSQQSLLHLKIRIPHKHTSQRHVIGLKRFRARPILIILERHQKTGLIPRSCLFYPHSVMNAYQQGRACREAPVRQSTQTKQWRAPNSSVEECIFPKMNTTISHPTDSSAMWSCNSPSRGGVCCTYPSVWAGLND